MPLLLCPARRPFGGRGRVQKRAATHQFPAAVTLPRPPSFWRAGQCAETGSNAPIPRRSGSCEYLIGSRWQDVRLGEWIYANNIEK